VALTKRVEVLFEPNEYTDLEAIARKQRESVGSLIRKATRQVYLDKERRKRAEAVKRLTSANLDLGNWEDLKKEMEETRYQDILKSMGAELTR